MLYFFAKNIGMNSIVINLKKSTQYLSYPFIFGAIFMLIGGVIAELPIEKIHSPWQDYSQLIINTLCVGFITFYTTKRGKKAVASTVTFTVSELAVFSICGQHYGIIIAVIFAFLSSRIYNAFDLTYSYIINLIAGLMLGILIGAAYPYIQLLLMKICAFFSGRGALFGAFNSLYEILFGKGLSTMFYSKDYTGAIAVEDGFIAGIRGIFESNTADPSYLTSEYLAGKYFANIFLPIGAYTCVYKKLDKNELNAFTLCAIISILFGYNTLFCAFLFLFNPIAYLGYMLVVFAGYYVARLLDIRAGYINEGSIIELIKYGDKWVYFILTGIVLALLSYFVLRICLYRFDYRDNKLLPRQVKQLVSALGGIDNIERINGDMLYVKNPNLINILKIDCDIHENQVSLLYDELEILKEYF